MTTTTAEYKGVVLSLFDYSGVAVRDWAEAGYLCLCFDIQHTTDTPEEPVGEGVIRYIWADLNPGSDSWNAIASTVDSLAGLPVSMLFAWPPCDDLTASGAKHFARKAAADPDFQQRAVDRARLSERLAKRIGCPYMIENPVGMLSTLWRKPDFIWNPYQYGGYLPSTDQHPRWPAYIAPRDAYTKKTGAWCGGGFVVPKDKPVQPEVLERVTASGRKIRGSRQFMKLGGSSWKTKTIRNETPRGFARAVFLANCPEERQRRFEERVDANSSITRAGND